MHLRTVFAGLILVASSAYAKDNGCSVSAESTTQKVNGVIVQKVVMSGDWGKTDATVYLPNRKVTEAAIVFSHSSIHQENGANVDLLPFAYTLARAGGAVIVPERQLVWPPSEAAMNREGAAAVCAGMWLASQVKVPHNGIPIVDDDKIVTREFYGYVGPRICDPKSKSRCHYIHPLFYPYKHVVWVPVGETEGGDNTSSLLADQGLWCAQWLQKRLGLHPINVIERPAGT